MNIKLFNMNIKLFNINIKLLNIKTLFFILQRTKRQSTTYNQLRFQLEKLCPRQAMLRCLT